MLHSHRLRLMVIHKYLKSIQSFSCSIYIYKNLSVCHYIWLIAESYDSSSFFLCFILEILYNLVVPAVFFIWPNTSTSEDFMQLVLQLSCNMNNHCESQVFGLRTDLDLEYHLSPKNRLYCKLSWIRSPWALVSNFEQWQVSISGATLVHVRHRVGV